MHAHLGLEDEMVVTLNGIELPVLVQPGQAKGTVSLALGYGRTEAGKVGDNLGVNAFRWVKFLDGVRSYTIETGEPGEELQNLSHRADPDPAYHGGQAHCQGDHP